MKKFIYWLARCKNRTLNIVLDFEIHDNSVYIKFLNSSEIELFDVQVEFSAPVLGFGGKKISELNIFKNLKYMAPYREFLIYVDEVDAFYQNLSNNIITVTISGKRKNKKLLHKSITYNLNIYRDLIIINKNPSS